MAYKNFREEREEAELLKVQTAKKIEEEEKEDKYKESFEEELERLIDDYRIATEGDGDEDEKRHTIDEMIQLVVGKVTVDQRAEMNEKNIEIDEISKKVEEYLQEEKEPTRSSLCLKLGIDYRTLALWQEGYITYLKFKAGIGDRRLKEIIQKAVYYINGEMEKKIPAAVMTEIFKTQGIISENYGKGQPPFDLGELDIYAH